MMRLERAVAARRRRIAQAVRAGFPDLTVTETADGVMLEGRGLWRRRIGDARLRAIGLLVRERPS